MKKAIIALTLAGCTNGYLVNVEAPKEVESGVYKKFVGVPLLLGLEGSYVRINDEWVLTARHNRPLFLTGEWVPHPTCDIALVKIKGNGGLNYGLAYSSDPVYHSGYPIGSGFSYTAGRYLGDAFVNSYPDCQMSASTGVMAKGMSGGAVTNSNGELVGILHGWSWDKVTWPNVSHSKPIFWTSINQVKDWIEEVTGETLYNE